jgi:putative resolvase
VSSSDQKADLERQLSRLGEFAVAQNYAVVAQIKEIGSGLNGHRPALLRLPHNPVVSIIVIEHRERLTRFGFEYVEAALAATGRRLVVMDQDELKDDIVRDITEVLTSLCARLYGKRSAQHRAQKAMAALDE